MSGGASGLVQFQVNKNNATRGIFFQREKPKTEARKFGYKSKNLRHPIRQPDHQEELERERQAAEEAKRKFNKNSTDFIRRNKDRYKPAEEPARPPPGTTHIAPGTVTLTQDQLAALLKTLGKSAQGGNNKENPLRISIDAENNKIEVEQYESDSNSDRRSRDGDDRRSTSNKHDDYDDDKGSDIGIEALLNGDDSGTKPDRKRNRGVQPKRPNRSSQKSRQERRSPEPDGPSSRAAGSNSVLARTSKDGGGSSSQVRMSWDDAKKEAGVAHVPDVVPWRHLTVAEKKRLQWARERAEVAEDYNPWGRPGGGAPPQKQSEVETQAEKQPAPPSRNDAPSERKKFSSSAERKKEELANEILQIQLEIREAEERKRAEEERLKGDKENREERKRSRKQESQGSRKPKPQETRETKAEKHIAKNEAVEEDNKVQIVIITKKKDKGHSSKERLVVSGETGDDSEKDVSSTKGRETSTGDRKDDGSKTYSDKKSLKSGTRASAPNKDRSDSKLREGSDDSGTSKPEVTQASSGGVVPPVNGRTQDIDESNLSKKELERRKWLAELDKQREEQRLKKQMEKERDRTGVHDQWADRFVYHKTPRQISPRASQGQGAGHSNSVPQTQHHDSRMRNQQGPDQTRNGPSHYTGADENAPPAAMRSSMVVGDGSLNENRYDNKKAEEKRKWLQELEQQREEQRMARQAQKERDRQENAGGGTWADHFPSSHQRQPQSELHNHNTSNNSSSNIAAIGGGLSPRMPQPNPARGAEDYDVGGQRVNSAPQHNLAGSEEGSTFLRGQGVFVDPVTRREQEEKRRVHLEYQAEIKAQIEEKERQKREERERKRREDMEEERKLQLERDKFNMQAEMEQKKLREKEEQRQKQIAVLKSAMDEAYDRAQEEKTHKRLHHLEQHGHDVSQLKAALDAHLTATSPRTKQFDVSAIPGLGPDLGEQNQRAASPPIQDLVDSARFQAAPVHQEQYQHQQQPQHQGRSRYPLGQSYTKEPYVEDRVLTPSRFRDPGRPRDLPDSPRREFGTQTLELKELQNILNQLPEDIQIEYKLRVEDALREKEEKAAKEKQSVRKVHVKSAEGTDKKKGAGMRGKPPQGTGKPPTMKTTLKENEEAPSGPKQRLAWNQRPRKTVVKNSERDPFYQQKKEEAEARRSRREKQLQYLQELNSGSIPTMHPQESHSRSRHEHCSPRREGEPEEGAAPAARGRHAAVGRRDASNRDRSRNRSQSPGIVGLHNDDKDVARRRQQQGKSKSPGPVKNRVVSTGRNSPPIPTVRHRTSAMGGGPTPPDTDRDPYAHANRLLRDSTSETRYGDAAYLPANEGEFVPFMRTTEILDPARAEEPITMSRENSRMERARQAYRETHNPAGKGRRVEIYQDREREAALKNLQTQESKNPLLNPGLVTDHPTGRQDMILQQLSSLKQTLMQRQRELETYMSPTQEGEAARD